MNEQRYFNNNSMDIFLYRKVITVKIINKEMYSNFVVSFKEELTANLNLISKRNLIYEMGDFAIFYVCDFSKYN